ncbi:sulfotransferase domain-containing protein [Bacteroides ihuae]|uniref:sulfotransferase domain-containing protein n=1 Tax=Bacteroides ihuae TaxID=1852362 RepID=UPI0008DA28DE|nr:sulfotransferase domain-containing protein [Bacteroides ihuae]
MKNIVWLVSYPKSGNTWFRMFLANYIFNAQQPLSLNKIEESPIASSAIDFEEETGLNSFELTPEEVDLYRPDIYRNLSKQRENIDGWLYKKTHDAYTLNSNKEPIFPADVTMGAVYFVRNPLDVCISYANHNASEISKTVDLIQNRNATIGGKRNGQLRQILLSWQDHYKSWNEQNSIPIHTVRYEDMQQRPLEVFGSIIKFLQLEYNEDRLNRAIINSDFKLLQQMEHEQGFKEKTQKAKSFFWKGTIGNYRNYLSENQINQIVDSSYETMKQLGYIDKNDILTI